MSLGPAKTICPFQPQLLTLSNYLISSSILQSYLELLFLLASNVRQVIDHLHIPSQISHYPDDLCSPEKVSKFQMQNRDYAQIRSARGFNASESGSLEPPFKMFWLNRSQLPVAQIEFHNCCYL